MRRQRVRKAARPVLVGLEERALLSGSHATLALAAPEGGRQAGGTSEVKELDARTLTPVESGHSQNVSQGSGALEAGRLHKAPRKGRLGARVASFPNTRCTTAWRFTFPTQERSGACTSSR